MLRDALFTSLLAGVLLIVASGCASTGGTGSSPSARPGVRAASAPSAEARTQSGKPEVVISGATKKQVIDALTNRMVSSGWAVAQTNDYQAVYETDAKGAAGFLSGVFYGQGTQPIYRVTAQFLETADGVRVIAGTELVSNPGTSRTTRTEMNSGKSRQQIQGLLDAVKNETARAVVPPPAPPDSSARR